MGSDWYELAIIAFILIGIAFSAWKGGAANPVPTGRLQTAVQKLQTDVKGLATSVDALTENGCTKGELKLLQQSFEAEQDRATLGFRQLELLGTELSEIRISVGSKHEVIDGLAESVRALSSRQETMSAQLASTDATLRSIDKQLGRIYDVVVPKGMG